MLYPFIAALLLCAATGVLAWRRMRSVRGDVSMAALWCGLGMLCVWSLHFALLALGHCWLTRSRPSELVFSVSASGEFADFCTLSAHAVYDNDPSVFASTSDRAVLRNLIVRMDVLGDSEGTRRSVRVSRTAAGVFEIEATNGYSRHLLASNSASSDDVQAAINTAFDESSPSGSRIDDRRANCECERFAASLVRGQSDLMQWGID